jgi:hypothetical protein
LSLEPVATWEAPRLRSIQTCPADTTVPGGRIMVVVVVVLVEVVVEVEVDVVVVI